MKKKYEVLNKCNIADLRKIVVCWNTVYDILYGLTDSGWYVTAADYNSGVSAFIKHPAEFEENVKVLKMKCGNKELATMVAQLLKEDWEETNGSSD